MFPVHFWIELCFVSVSSGPQTGLWIFHSLVGGGGALDTLSSISASVGRNYKQRKVRKLVKSCYESRYFNWLNVDVTRGHQRSFFILGKFPEQALYRADSGKFICQEKQNKEAIIAMIVQ